MNIFRKIRLKFWRTMASIRHRHTTKYAKLLGVKVAENVKFTGLPDFDTEPWLIEIGARCLITQNVRFMTHDGSVSIVRRLEPQYKDIMKFGKIIIENDVFIGANTVIMPSVRVGSYAIVAACSCVTKDIPSGEVWGGVPAKKIGTVADYADKLLEIRSEYPSEHTTNMSKKELSTLVAEVYWSKKHS